MRVMVTGGAGFIGSALVRSLVRSGQHEVLTFDLLTYAGRLENLGEARTSPRHRFLHADILDRDAVQGAFADFAPDLVFHLAAETHVDRSIDSAAPFVSTNIEGTFVMVEAAHRYWRSLSLPRKDAFRFIHVSTDEVYGTLPLGEHFRETSPYRPNSPYAASKAAADMLARAWHRTFGFPIIITNCSNNYGPHQYPEKLIPLTILNALHGQPIPIYGDGRQVRDWLYVDDHVDALQVVAGRGRPGEVYCIGGEGELENLALVTMLCETLDELRATASWHPHRSLIRYVDDRPGHDRRYAMDISRIQNELGWQPKVSAREGLRRTVLWYIDNQEWCGAIREGEASRRRRGVLAPGGAS